METHSEKYWEGIYQLIKNQAREQSKCFLRNELIKKQNSERQNTLAERKNEILVKQVIELVDFEKINIYSNDFLAIITPEEWLKLQKKINERFLSFYQAEYFCHTCHKGGIPKIKNADCDPFNRTHTTFRFEKYTSPSNLIKCPKCQQFFCPDHLHHHS